MIGEPTFPPRTAGSSTRGGGRTSSRRGGRPSRYSGSPRCHIITRGNREVQRSSPVAGLVIGVGADGVVTAVLVFEAVEAAAGGDGRRLARVVLAVTVVRAAHAHLQTVDSDQGLVFPLLGD